DLVTGVQTCALPISISLTEVVRECHAMIEPQAQKRGIAMTFPEFEATCFVKADRTRLKQVLINLLSNAIKYNRPGGSVVVDYARSEGRRVGKGGDSR